jgi:hypothetical protein
MTGHLEQGVEMNFKADMKHNWDWLQFFEDLGLPNENGKIDMTPAEIMAKFTARFPDCKENNVSDIHASWLEMRGMTVL